jgi:hypothetical protein
MINKDLLKQLIIEEKKKHKMNLVEQAPAAPAAAPAAPAASGIPAPAAKPATGQAAPATLNMADADIAAAVSGWAQLLKNAKSPAFAKLKPFFDANKVKIT